MSTKQRSEIVNQTDIVVLKVQFQNQDGYLTDLDFFPNFSIVEPSGNIIVGPTSSGVYKISTGLYAYNYEVGINGSIGVYFDVWNGLLNGVPVTGSFNFVVHNTQMPAINTDGYMHLGDHVPFNYSQIEILNINKLITGLKTRLNSSGKAKSKDEFGNTIYVDCDIYSVEQLVTFIISALSAFNQIPHFTNFTFSDTDFIAMFYEVLLQHAVIYALSSKALIERGREFTLSDNGISFQPPGVSEVLMTQFSTELNNWFEKAKLIKQNCKVAPLGLGTLSSLGSNRALMKFRWLREKQII